jgi:hypothetical protein
MNRWLKSISELKTRRNVRADTIDNALKDAKGITLKIKTEKVFLKIQSDIEER